MGFIRNCPKCDKILTYSTQGNLTAANKKNCFCNSCRHTGKKVSNETKNKIRDTQTGKKHTKETKEKMSRSHLGNTGKFHTNEAKEKISKGNIGKIRTENTKENLRQQAIVRWEQGVYDNNRWIRGESYPESVFREFLESFGAVKGEDFFQEHRVGRYSIDFAYIDEQGKRAIEIDGSQHLLPEAIEHDRIRDEYLTEQGWIIYRIPVKNLYKFLEPMWATEH